jgi:hypothetical protein
MLCTQDQLRSQIGLEDHSLFALLHLGVFTGQCTLRVNARFEPDTPPIFQHPQMPNESDIQAALEEVANSDKPNYAAIADKHNVHPSTLSRRARGITQSREEIAS